MSLLAVAFPIGKWPKNASFCSKKIALPLLTEAAITEKVPEREKMSVSTTAYLARRAAQKERVQILYRRALRDTLNWAVHRHLFYQDVHFPNLNISFRSHSNSALTYVINTKFFFINPGFEPPREVRRQKACGSFSLFSEIFVLITKAVLVSL